MGFSQGRTPRAARRLSATRLWSRICPRTESRICLNSTVAPGQLHDRAVCGSSVRFNGWMVTDSDPDLSPGELALLSDAARDDVSFVWVLIDLGLRANPPSSPDWRPGPREIDSAFHALERLHS